MALAVTGPVIRAGEALSDAVDCSAYNRIARIITRAFRSGTHSLPVPQAADCNFQLIMEVTSSSSRQATQELVDG